MYSYINKNLGLVIVVPAIILSMLLVNSAHAQTTTDTSAVITTDVPAATPGAPNTGAGGNAAANALILLASASVSVGGLIYLTRKSSRSQVA